MTVGIICEGGMTDEPVLNLLLSHLFPRTNFLIRGVSKRAIFEACDTLLNDLFDHPVDRAIVIWDLLPTGNKMGVVSQWSERPSRREQRQVLIEKLRASTSLKSHLKQQADYFASKYRFVNEEFHQPNENSDLYVLICVCFALDGWLLSDPNLLCNLASTAEHKIRRLDPEPPQPDHCQNPVLALKRAFSTAPDKRWRFYNKIQHNLQIARAYVELEKVACFRASQSFRRLEETLQLWGCR